MTTLFALELNPTLAAWIIGITGAVMISITVNLQAKKFWREIERMHDNMNNEDS